MWCAASSVEARSLAWLLMSAKTLEMLDPRSRDQWRAWLQACHDSESEVWLVFHKRHTAKESISYDDAVEEALCFGWIDSMVRRLDDDRYARKFTPRRPDSRWSTTNRRRYATLKANGLLAAAGLKRPPTARSGDAPRRQGSALPFYIEKGLKGDARALKHFEQLAPAYRKAYVDWIDSAKREETKVRRLREAVRLLAAGQRLGLK